MPLEWSDEGILLHLKPHGESGAIATLFTQNQGICKGYVRPSKKYPLQPGSLYYISSKSRLSSQLSILSLEPDEMFSTYLCLALINPQKLSAINAIRALLHLSIIELNTPAKAFYTITKHCIEHICRTDNLHEFARFEMELLSYCGFGLDLDKCAVTHETENLTYVSPKTGRAVSESVGRPYAKKLFKLPSPLKNIHTKWSKEAILESLEISGFFLNKMLQDHLNKSLPSERNFFISLLKKV